MIGQTGLLVQDLPTLTSQGNTIHTGVNRTTKNVNKTNYTIP